MQGLLSILFIYLVLAGTAAADEVRPGYLEFKSADGEAYTVKWKVPMKGNSLLNLQPDLPVSCRELTPQSSTAVGGAMITQWSIHCETGLAGQEIAVNGLEKTSTDVLVRIVQQNDAAQMFRLTPAETRFQVPEQTSAWDVIRIYSGLGIEHILLGIDHLLFVFALLLIVKGWKRLVGTITAFTLAHSITLAAATLGYVHVPQAPVEAVIALSILFLATEIIHGMQGRQGLAERYPWLVAFIFGLLHGFGFAGALAEIGLPEHSIPLALLFFNVGVELGQLMFVAAVVVAVLALRQISGPKMLFFGRGAAAYLIGGVSAFWVIERTYSFWT
mgnify:FL=1